MIIRTGLLCIPELDDDACAAIRRALRERVPGSVVMVESSVRSQRNWIEETLRRWCDEEELDLVLTLGGTLPAPGPSALEITPEATLAVVDRLTPGLTEAMRAHAWKVSELALLDRSVAGIRSRTLIVNLPEGAAPALLFLEAIVEILPAILAHLQSAPTAPRLADELEITAHPSEQQQSGPATGSTPSNPGLQVDEFAAFLQRRADASD